MAFSLVLLLLAAAQPAEAEGTEDETPAVRQASTSDDEEICRRKTIPHPKMANRTKSVKICKTRDEWREEATRRKW